MLHKYGARSISACGTSTRKPHHPCNTPARHSPGFFLSNEEIHHGTQASKGTQFGFAPVVSTAIATSAISKAAPALASVAANIVDTGDVVVIELRAGRP